MIASTEIALAAAGLGAAAALVLAGLQRRTRRIERAVAYLKGVRYVLSDSPDAAIGELTRAVELHPGSRGESIETYFALGKLFRRKGDLERAIRLHQNILLRPGLPPETKREAQLELAIDLQRAGMHARAAESLEKFLADSPNHPEALQRLREVREAARDLGGAVEAQVRAVKAGLGGENVLAHLLAQAARDVLATDPTQARELSQAALQAFPGSTDATLALAEVLIAQGDGAAAAERLKGALDGDPASALEIAGLLERAVEAPEVVGRILADQLLRSPGEPTVRVAHARALVHAGERERAAAELRQVLALEPGFGPARRELGALLLGSPLEGELKRAFEELLRALDRPEQGYVCERCRLGTARRSWRCERCHSWDAIRRATEPAPGHEIDG